MGIMAVSKKVEPEQNERVILDREVIVRNIYGEDYRVLSFDRISGGRWEVQFIQSGMVREFGWHSLDCVYMKAEDVSYLIGLGARNFTRLPEKFLRMISREHVGKLLKKLRYLNQFGGTERWPIIVKENHIVKGVEEIDLLACRALITPDGRCNWGAIEELKENGFRVFPGETDGFGWLTGCIETQKGIVVFG
ncbi:hypothetical protein [Aneurinibacillus thermoaerophilus]|uniref:hypothetical protein n=1 Tax=Aneurinibacillus thermoaerophilus TaxID=143495 RepID=UPI002E231FFF|nr:hypothetical protein [Aneurinibacillus thermoaerophilus]